MLLATALKNAILKEAAKRPNCSPEIVLKNIMLNGKKTGCSGFIRSVESGGVVYVSTEHSVYGPIADSSLYRYAANMQDYSSNGLTNGHNHFCKDSMLAKNVVDMLCEGIGHKKKEETHNV